MLALLWRGLQKGLEAAALPPPSPSPLFPPSKEPRSGVCAGSRPVFSELCVRRAAPTEPAVQVAAAPLGQAGAAGSGWAGCVIHITAVLCGAFRLMGKADQLLTQQILVCGLSKAVPLST